MSARPAPAVTDIDRLVLAAAVGLDRRAELLSLRTDLRFAAIDDRWYAPRRRRRRLARLAAIEAALARRPS